MELRHTTWLVRKKKGANGAGGVHELTKDEETRHENMVDGTEGATFYIPKLDLTALHVDDEDEEPGMLGKEVRVSKERKTLPETLDPWIPA